MPDSKWLRDVLSNNQTTQPDRLMVVLLDTLDDDATGMLEAEIKDVCEKHGMKASTWNISAALGPAKKDGFVTFAQTRWHLTSAGRDYLRDKHLIPPQKTTLAQTSHDLRTRLASVLNPDAKEFVEDAIMCLEANIFRPAIVMSWLGAVMVLRDHLVGDPTRLSDFNTKAQTLNKSWAPAKTTDDLSAMSDGELLRVLEESRIITLDAQKALKQCLERRNTCAHANSFQIGELQVAAHIETLILNVYAKF